MQLPPRTPRTTAATRRHITELELILVRFWLPFGFRERKTKQKTKQTKALQQHFPHAPGGSRDVPGVSRAKANSPELQGHCGDIDRGDGERRDSGARAGGSAGGAEGGGTAGLQPLTSSPSWPELPPKPPPAKSTTKPSSESCSSPSTSSEGSAEQEAMG